MKQNTVFLRFFALVLLTAVLSAGCESGSPGETAAASCESGDAVEPAAAGFAERIAGSYYACGAETEGEPDVFLEIYFIDGHLIAEADETYAAYWAMELIPSDEADLYRTESDTLQVTAFTFSGFSDFGEYWPESEQYTISITGEGVDFAPADGTTVSYFRDDTPEPQHDPERYREILGEGTAAVKDAGLAGGWKAETEDGTGIFLRIEENGVLRCLCKRDGEPVRVHIGLAAVDAERTTLTGMTERVGWAEMPWNDTIGYAIGTDGRLTLDAPEDCGMLPGGMKIVFEKQ